MTADMSVRIQQMRYESETVMSVQLAPVEPGKTFPKFGAGAHIDMQFSPTLRRSYSLCDLSDGSTLTVAIHRDPNSRGGSEYVHEKLRVGDIITISPPKNNFRLHEDAEETILFAGGIGITPILCMIRKLQQNGQNWTLHYAARNRNVAAFTAELTRLDGGAGRVHFHFDDEQNGALLDIAGIVKTAHIDTHFYCCGPVPMLNAFEQATAKVDPKCVHLEYFSAQEEAAREGGFEVVLARSKKSFHIPPGKTILDVFIHEKVNVPFSCSDGVCGTCETRVIEGIPDHRDSFLTDDEKEGNATIMVCCSGSKTAKLVLDL